MSEFTSKLCFQAMVIKSKIAQLMKNENGEANIIAIILILAIVIILAIVFRTQLTSLFQKIWSSLFTNVDNVLN